MAVAACLVALAFSTTGLETALQTWLFAAVLALSPRSPGPWLRFAGSLLLGIGLAAYVILPMSGLIAGSARDAGFATSVVLAHSVHPMTLVQVLVGSLYGDPGRHGFKIWV